MERVPAQTTSAVTKRRTAHGHLQVWFVARPESGPRKPLTPLAGAQAARPLARRMSNYNRWGAQDNHRWRGNMGRLRHQRPCRPAGRTYSCRAPSLREGELTPSVLVQSGTHFEARQPAVAATELIDECLTAPWLHGIDEYGSNDFLFATVLSPAAVEGSTGHAPLPATEECLYLRSGSGWPLPSTAVR